jgi:hypothetical protein
VALHRIHTFTEGVFVAPRHGEDGIIVLVDEGPDAVVDPDVEVLTLFFEPLKLFFDQVCVGESTELLLVVEDSLFTPFRIQELALIHPIGSKDIHDLLELLLLLFCPVVKGKSVLEGV